MWYPNPGWQKVQIAEGGWQTVGGAVGDVDGDGDPDIVPGAQVWFENPLPKGDPAKAPWPVHRISNVRSHDAALADLDRDGRLDLIARDQSGFGRNTGNKIHLWRQAAQERWEHHAIECPHQPVELWLNRTARSAGDLRGGPQPGDVFREYLWTNVGGDASGSLRVGGRLDYGGGPIVLSHRFDLEHAVRAEIVLEKLLCHDGTRGLAVSVNSNAWIQAPEAPGIPRPQWDYMHHTYPVVTVPLTQLKAGGENQVRLRVSEEHPWKWPQNLIYGVHFRIYYDAALNADFRGAKFDDIFNER